MKNILKKTLKFISSRLIYLIIGIFLAVSISYIYAAWNDAKTGDSGQLSQSNWNTLVNEVHNKCGGNCDAKATAATASSDILTENNWNNLIDLVNNTLVDCTDNNGGKCFVNQTSKSALDTDLTAGNIKSGTNIFGVAGSYAAPSPANCTDDNTGECYITQATKNALDSDLVAEKIKPGYTIFGITGVADRCSALMQGNGCSGSWTYQDTSGHTAAYCNTWCDGLSSGSYCYQWNTSNWCYCFPNQDLIWLGYETFYGSYCSY